MAAAKKADKGSIKLERIKFEIFIPESYLTGIFWNNPEQYDFYPEDKIKKDTFLNPVWGFYFGLGRYMYEQGIKIFDDISIFKHIKEINVEAHFDKYGGFETVKEMMDEVKYMEDNLEGYYNQIKKHNLLRNLSQLFGEKVLDCHEKYDYKQMDKEELYTYWIDKVNSLWLDGDSTYDEHFLLEGLAEEVDEWDKNPNIGLDFYDSKWMTEICTGWDFGNIYIYGGFGGSGKTSLTFSKIIMSCIQKQQKLLILANEQGISEFRKLLVATALGIKKDYLRRQRLNQGSFSTDEREMIDNCLIWLEEFSQGNSKLIAFVFLEDYIIRDVKKIVKKYAFRGYKSVIIDTAKPSEDNPAQMARWEVFTEDFKQIYKVCRANGGGLNLRMWINVQLADGALNRRFLNEHALGDSKKIKNEASVMFMGRNVWDDEFEGGDFELNCYRFEKKTEDNDPFDFSESEETKIFFKLPRTHLDHMGRERPNQFMLIFTPKNRRGMDNKGGQHILILQLNFNENSWHEVGWCAVSDDKNY